MGTKGSQTTTNNSSPTPQAMTAYNNLLTQAGGVASTPYQAYGGQLVAPVNAQQQTGIGAINQNAGFAQPYIQQAATYANNAAQPLTAQQIQQYQSPYTQQVVNATEAQFNNQNAQQQSQVVGNAAMQGALGGDRVGVAQANLAGQQQLAQAPVIAGLYNQGYGQAVQTAEQQQQNQAMAAYSLGNIGVSGQNAALSGANAQVGAGSLEQQTQQQQDTAAYGQFAQAQAFPYQQTQWLAGIDTGVGSQMGGTSSTTAPAPNPLNTIAGLGVTAAGAYFGAKRGGRIAGFDSGGPVMPYSGASGWIPGVGIVRGQGAPRPPGTAPSQPLAGFSPSSGAGIGRGLANFGVGSPMTGDQNVAMGQGYGVGFDVNGDALPAFGSGSGAARGGRIAGFADGGAPTFADQWGSLADTPYAPLSADDVVSGSPFTLPPEVPAQASGNGVPLPLPRPTVNYTGGDINASDINLNGGSGGLGLGSPYESTNPALTADAGVNPGIPGNPGASRTPIAGVGAGPGAPLAYGSGYAPQAGVAGVGPSGGPQNAGGLGGFLAGLPGRGSISSAAVQGLMAAGLGMMASRSPFLGQAIGEGGLRGLSEYAGVQQRELQGEVAKSNMERQQQQTALEGRKVDIESQRLADEADRWQKQIGLETGKESFLENQPRVVPMGAQLVSPQGPNAGKVIASNSASILNPNAVEVGARRLANGDSSALSGLPQGTAGAAARAAIVNRAADIRVNENGESPENAAAFVTAATQQVHAAGIGQGAEARTAGTREANLNMILATTDSAIPAALEASKNVARTGWVPINQIIQKGEVIASDPDLKSFGMANLQLAEGWARAMNPTGVMRESDRDKALSFLSTADSQPTYERAVNQLRTQIQRERDAVHGQRPVMPGGPAPSESAATGSVAGASSPPASALKEGTHTTFKNGQTWTLQNGQPVQVQ